MQLPRNDYHPEGTETFDFFGHPPVQPVESPVACLLGDIKNVFMKSSMINSVLLAFWTERSIDELYLWAPTAFSLVWFTFWSLMQLPLILTGLAIFSVTAVVISALTTVHDFLVWRVVQGPQLQVYPPKPPTGYEPRHRWVYLNGVATGKTIVRQNLECLSATFNNPVLAVNNRTYGFMGDIMECILQRALGYRSKETGIAYNIIKAYLKDDAEVDKVILIAHSQGGIIASQILDDLFCDVSADELSKLEVYTFGNAALKFNNPWTDKTRTKCVIPVMEHYCNERDMVTSWGALNSVDRDDLPFAGTVFVLENQTGHLLNQHYLKNMFTGPEHSWAPGNFLLRAVEKDTHTPNKFYVTSVKADAVKGQRSVKSMSELWKYMG